MTSTEAWGWIVLCSLGAALAVWVVCFLWFWKTKRLPENDAWNHGYEIGRGSLDWAKRLETRRKLGR